VRSYLFAHLRADDERDPALPALALTLPHRGYVAALAPDIDADVSPAAHALLARELAREHRVAFAAVRARTARHGPYEKIRAQIAARSLSNVALWYLGARDDPAGRAAAVLQYERADNMTDAFAALVALRDGESAERHRIYAHFEGKWRNEPLVLDKWFSLEARSARRDTLARVKTLCAHPRFNARNPNRVRALVGAFAVANFARFHASDGSGYAFAAEQVRALDASNPQLAATITGAFNLWKRFPPPRRGMMEAALTRIARSPALSPDVSEVVARTLQD
jgi:aminopeptidase N